MQWVRTTGETVSGLQLWGECLLTGHGVGAVSRKAWGL